MLIKKLPPINHIAPRRVIPLQKRPRNPWKAKWLYSWPITIFLPPHRSLRFGKTPGTPAMHDYATGFVRPQFTPQTFQS